VAGEVAAAEQAVAEAYEVLVVAEKLVDEARLRLERSRQRYHVISAKLTRTQQSLAATHLDLRATERRLASEAVTMYMDASLIPALGILTSASVTETVIAVAYAGDLFGVDASLFDTLDLLRAEEERQKTELIGQQEQASRELVRVRDEQSLLRERLTDANLAHDQAERDVAAARSLLGRINADIRAAEQHKEGLEADAARLVTEIGKRRRQDGQAPGRLAWPVNGLVSSPFGYRVHPILGGRRLHGGIDIDASTGTPIGAAEAGVVLVAETFGGYGMAVVIDHGGGLATLYAHQSRLAVSRGDQVARGQVLGYVGCTGYCTGPHLHFEVWENEIRVDPMRFLRG
jgi:murein DD-endopeptidase MepM/ murein hydrolase activator NlpD